MPLDEVEVLYKVDCFNAYAVEKRNWITTIDIEKVSNNATDIGTDFDDAFRPGYHPQTFNGGLQKFVMRFNKIEFVLVLSKLLWFMMHFNLSNIIMTDKTQNCD